jgi:hypothetical protein
MLRNYILLPNRGMRSRFDAQPVKDFFNLLNTHRHTARAMSLKPRSVSEKRNAIKMQVLDSIHENGAKLVEVHDDEMAELRLSYPGVRILPEVFYKKALAPRMQIMAKPVTLAAKPNTKYGIKLLSAKGTPVEKAEIFLYTNYKDGVGAKAVTNKSGMAVFNLPPFSEAERIYVYPLHSHWPRRVQKPVFNNKELTITLADIDTSFNDILGHFYPHTLRTPVSSKIKIGVIDTGAGPHKYIPIKGGVNFVRGEQAADFMDNGDGHGTHVAGIIAGMGEGRESGFRGLAPGATVFSYRVFGSDGGDASNFSIMKAIDKAVEDGCDLINLSLGSAEEDNGIAESIAEAYTKGVVCFAATGNEDRSPVSFPASAQFSIAVSAFGRKKTWPEGSLQSEMVKSPYGSDLNNFIASFSNVGAQVDLAAPGVAITSGYPGNLYAVLDGTSMACPAATAMAARLLDATPAVFGMTRNSTRANEIVKLVSTHASSLGFRSNFEGKGLLSHKL